MEKIEPNYYELDDSQKSFETGFAPDSTPAFNGSTTDTTEGNITSTSNGSVVNGGNLRSGNYITGTAGWKLDSNGNLEANNGNFRGDITGASGTFSGSVAVGSLNIPDSSTTNSMHVETDGDTFWGATPASFTSNNENAPAYVLKTGVAKFQQLTVTGQTTSLIQVPLSRPYTADENLTAGDAVRVVIDNNSVTDASTSTTEREVDGQSGRPTKVGTKYTTGSTLQFVNFATFFLEKTGSPGTLTVNLRSGSITGTILATGTVAEGSIPTTGAEVTVTFANIVKLSASTDYYLELAPTTTNASNYISHYAGATGGGAGTKYWTFTGSWNSFASPSMYLKIGLSNGTPGRIKKAKAPTSAEAELFIGFALATTNSGNMCQVLLNGVVEGLTLTGAANGSINYYLTDTAGTIDITPGTVTVKVGKALTSSTLLITNLW